MLFDLNAHRAAQSAEPKTLRVDDREFALKGQIPLAVSSALDAGDLALAARFLLADPDADHEDFVARVSMDELGWIMKNYGSGPGESSGSPQPSTDTGEPSQPTSDVSTTSASPLVVMDPVLSGQPTSTP